ncbi:MAG: TIGR02281 family clan AA aspartic protease [Gammaproteobacteria bacterium]
MIRTALVFLLGAALGALAVWHFRPVATLPVVMAPSEPPALQTSSLSRGDGTIWVTLQNGANSRRVLAIALRDPGVLLIQFDDFVRARQAYWRSADGGRRELGPAVAFDLELGLLAFALPDDAPDGLVLSRQDGALYLGRDVRLRTADRSFDAFVDSAAIERGPNDYRYFLKAASDEAQNTAAVTLPEGDELVGLAGRDADGRWLATDAGTLRAFLERPLAQPVTSLEQFSQLVFEQPAGLAVEFDRLARAGRWEAAIERAARLRHWRPALLASNERLSTYYLCVTQHARALIATDRLNDALNLLTRSLADYGGNEDLLTLTYDATARRDGHAQAIARIRELTSSGGAPFVIDADAKRRVLRQRATRFVAAGEASQDAGITLMTTLIADDQDYAPYHRLLGNLLFDAGRYSAAQFHLRRAIELEPGYAAQLQGRLTASVQRRQTTELIEAPLQSAGSALYVDVQLNGNPQSFRFLIDTGASITAINTSTLLRLGLNDIFNRGAPPIELETANGRVFAQSFTLDSVNVAGAIVEQVPVVLLEDMGPLDGLLGLSFLRHFDVQINQRENKLLLTPR